MPSSAGWYPKWPDEPARRSARRARCNDCRLSADSEGPPATPSGASWIVRARTVSPEDGRRAVAQPCSVGHDPRRSPPSWPRTARAPGTARRGVGPCARAGKRGLTSVRPVGGSRRFLARLGLVTAAAGVWRIWYVVAVADPRTPKLALSDETFYHQQARLVADGVGFVNPFGYFAPVGTPAHRVFETAVHPPAYTMFLAVPAKLGIDSVLSQRILTALLGTATVFLLGLLGRRIAGERAGIIAAVLGAVAPALWVNDAVLGLETLFCFCLVIALLCAYKFWSAPSIGPVLGMAAAMAVAALTRSEGTLLFVLLVLPVLLLVPGASGRDRAKYVGATALVAVLVMGPWVVRNLT